MRFKYTVIDDTPTGLAPRLSFTLQHGAQVVEVTSSLDSGAAVNLTVSGADSVGRDLGGAAAAATADR